MKRMFAVMLVALCAFSLTCVSGCDGETAKEKEWKKDIPNVPAGDTSKSRAPAGGEKPK